MTTTDVGMPDSGLQHVPHLGADAARLSRLIVGRNSRPRWTLQSLTFDVFRGLPPEKAGPLFFGELGQLIELLLGHRPQRPELPLHAAPGFLTASRRVQQGKSCSEQCAPEQPFHR